MFPKVLDNYIILNDNISIDELQKSNGMIYNFKLVKYRPDDSFVLWKSDFTNNFEWFSLQGESKDHTFTEIENQDTFKVKLFQFLEIYCISYRY